MTWTDEIEIDGTRYRFGMEGPYLRAQRHLGYDSWMDVYRSDEVAPLRAVYSDRRKRDAEVAALVVAAKLTLSTGAHNSGCVSQYRGNVSPGACNCNMTVLAKALAPFEVVT